MRGSQVTLSTITIGFASLSNSVFCLVKGVLLHSHLGALGLGGNLGLGWEKKMSLNSGSELQHSLTCLKGSGCVWGPGLKKDTKFKSSSRIIGTKTSKGILLIQCNSYYGAVTVHNFHFDVARSKICL